MKALATHLYDDGLRGETLVAEFEAIVPHWKEYFEKPISDDAIAHRADRRGATPTKTLRPIRS